MISSNHLFQKKYFRKNELRVNTYQILCIDWPNPKRRGSGFGWTKHPVEGLGFDVAVQQIVFQKHLETVRESEVRIAGIEKNGKGTEALSAGPPLLRRS